MIGPNGAGKSNFIGVFRMLAKLIERRLQLYVAEQDGPDALLFGTRKKSPELGLEFNFDRNGYRVRLRPSGERLIFASEETLIQGDLNPNITHNLGAGHDEALLPDIEDDAFARYVRPTMPTWRVYHFHDTSNTAAVRQAAPVRDNLRLHTDAGNLAPYLRHLSERHPEQYRQITDAVRKVAPFFGGFIHRPDPGDRGELEWFEVD